MKETNKNKTHDMVEHKVEYTIEETQHSLSLLRIIFFRGSTFSSLVFQRPKIAGEKNIDEPKPNPNSNPNPTDSCLYFITLFIFTLWSLRLKTEISHPPKNGTWSTTFDPPTMEEPSPTRRRTQQLGKAAGQVTHKIQVRLQTLGLLNH